MGAGNDVEIGDDQTAAVPDETGARAPGDFLHIATEQTPSQRFVGNEYYCRTGLAKYFDAIGMSPGAASTLLQYIGLLDLTIAAIVLLKPIRAVVLWAAFWGFWTALIRWPIGPDPFWDFVERFANWGAPLALLLLLGWPKKFHGWFNAGMKK